MNKEGRWQDNERETLPRPDWPYSRLVRARPGQPTVVQDDPPGCSNPARAAATCSSLAALVGPSVLGRASGSKLSLGFLHLALGRDLLGRGLWLAVAIRFPWTDSCAGNSARPGWDLRSSVHHHSVA